MTEHDEAADADRRRRLLRLARVAWWLDDRFRVPILGRVGLDGLVGLVPVVGDTATALTAAWIVVEARRLGMPRRKVALMAMTVGVDWLLGLTPLVGDLLDIRYKANRRNIRRIFRHFNEPLP